MSKPVAIDLFCGCGGLTLGLKQAGFKVIGAIDNDRLAIETYRKNHEDVDAIWARDIRHLTARQVRRRLDLQEGDLDLLAGCPPCQGFSSLRTLNGNRTVEDSRNDLVFQFRKFVKTFKPKAIMMENVPGLASDERIHEFCHCLRKLGYDPNFWVLNAADYGAPQRRRRMILLAGRSGPINYAQPNYNRSTVRQAIGSLAVPGESGDAIHDFPEKRSKRVLKLIRRIPKDGGSRSSLSKRSQLPCHRDCDGFKDIYGRMAWDDVAPTITGGCVNPSKGRFLHPEQNRCITLREAALLQGFPPGYSFSLKRGKFAAAELIGNALPPEFVRRHAGQVLNYLQTRVNAAIQLN